MRRAKTFEWDEPEVAVLNDRGKWPRILFGDFLAGLKGTGFITSSDLLQRMEDTERRDRVVIQDGPISGSNTWQGTLKALGHLMRAHGHPPVKGTHGVRGYLL